MGLATFERPKCAKSTVEVAKCSKSGRRWSQMSSITVKYAQMMENVENREILRLPSFLLSGVCLVDCFGDVGAFQEREING